MSSQMDSQELFRIKTKGPGSGASSVRSGKSKYIHKGASSSQSGASALIREIASQIPEKDKPQAERLTQKIREIKDQSLKEQVTSMYETLIVPYNRRKYYDCVEENSLQEIQEIRENKVNKITSIVMQSSLVQQKEVVTRTQVIAKFQRITNQLIIAFRHLKPMYFQSDLYRVIYASQWTNFEKGAKGMLNSAFIESRFFVAKYIQRLAYKELLGESTNLPQSFSEELINLLLAQATGEFLAEIQLEVLETFIALARIQHFRGSLVPAFEFFIDLHKQGLIFKSNLKCFAHLLSELALYEDIDWRKFKLLDLYLELMKNPSPPEDTSLEIIEQKFPEILTMYRNVPLEEDNLPVKEQPKPDLNQQSAIGRKLSRKSSIASMSSIRRTHTRSGMFAQRSHLRDFGNSELQRTERIKEQRKVFNDLERAKYKEVMERVARFDACEAQQIVIQAAKGLSRLMIPNNSTSFINNVGSAKPTIYEEMLQRNLISEFLNHEVMDQEFSEVKKSLTTAIAMFVLQTTCESIYEGEHVIFILKRLGILECVSKWSKDPDLEVRANSAWMFTALCVQRLVPPLELTKTGIIRDMFVLFIKLYLEPKPPQIAEVETEDIAEKVLKMYDYENFSQNLSGILNKKEKVQHLIFATFVFLSIYDDPDIISAVHKVKDIEVDKRVEENALCGLMELLQQDSDKMKLFVKILIQFTICDDDSFQQNGIWYLKHIIINPKLNQLVESQKVGILEVFIAGSVCESEVIQQECVNVLTYLAIEKKAYQNKEDPLLDSLMYLTGVQFKTIRGLAYNGLAALALHGEYAANILIQQAEIQDYFNTVTKNLKKFRQEFVNDNYKSDTVAEYAGINLLLNLSRSATLKDQKNVSSRVPLILDTIAAQNQLSSENNMNEVGCLQTIRALMCSKSLEIKEDWVVPFIKRVASDKSFRLYSTLINNKFVPWCLQLLLDSQTPEKCIETSDLLRFILYEFYNEMTFEQEETNIREVFKSLMKKFKWNEDSNHVHERLVECCLLIFVREKNIILAVTEEVIQQITQVRDTFDQRSSDTKLALSKHLASTANLPQIQNLLLKTSLVTIEIIQKYMNSQVYEERFNVMRLLVFLTKSTEFNKLAFQHDILRKLCKMFSTFDSLDLHPLIMSVNNLLVSSRELTDDNEFLWFHSEGYFQDLLKKAKENDSHSLNESFLDLVTKLLVEKDFTNFLFSEDLQAKRLLKDLLYVLLRGIKHECEKRCSDMSNHPYKFSVHSYPISWLSLKKHAFNVTSQLFRLGQCFNKLKKHKIGDFAVKWFKKACKHMQNKRTVDPLCESLLGELCVYLQLHYGILREEHLAEQVLKFSKTMAGIIRKEKGTDLVQARIGALLLHSSLTAPVPQDFQVLVERIHTVLFAMTTDTSLPELHNLAVWSLKQLYLKCQANPPSYSYQDAFLKAKAVQNIIPKLVEPFLPVQENALMCLGSLFENEEMKAEFLDFRALPNLMYLGQSAKRSLESGQKDFSLLIGFGSALSSLVKDKQELQSYLAENYSMFSFIANVINTVKHNQDTPSVKLLNTFGTLLNNMLENYELHQEFLNCPEANLNSMLELLHSSESPTYEQLKVDNNVVRTFYLLADNPKNNFHNSPNFQLFAKLVNKICTLYSKGDYLSKTEVSTHCLVVETLQKLIKQQFKRYGLNPTEDEREDYLQELNNSGGLDPLFFFEASNVPKIRQVASDTFEFLAPSEL